MFVGLLLATLSLSLLLDRREIREALRSQLLWALLIPPFAVLGMLHQRNLPYAAVILAPVVATLVPLALRRPTAAEPAVPPTAGGLVVAAVMAVAVIIGLLGAPPSPDLTSYPVGAVGILSDRPGNLFHEYDWGGYLIFALPQHPTYIDGRGAALFPPALVQEFQDTVALRPTYRDVLTARDIRFVLVRPNRALAVALQEQGWRVLGREPTRWILLERP